MQEINLELSDNNYNIFIGNDYFNEIPHMIEQSFSYQRLYIISDKNVSELYLNNWIEHFNCEIYTYIIEPGENSKSLSVLGDIYSDLAIQNITRKDAIIALGGGVVGDLAGFAAATYLRGIDFIQVPTSLLAQVDSSVGGKVAVNIKEGKNLVGNFYQPKAVYIDVKTLETLNIREIKSGLAEVIKYGCIYDLEFYRFLKQLNIESLKDHYEKIITKCVEIKAEYVRLDEKEASYRMHLNFGHTIGHGIEKYFDFKRFNHGESVAIGMFLMIKMDVYLSKLGHDVLDDFEELLANFEMEYKVNVNVDEIFKYIVNDKKSTGNSINIIRLKSIGNSYIECVDINWFRDILRELL